MKSAIVSDIHSNLEAFSRCVDHARAQGAARFICLGDIVGYGADPAATLRLLISLPGLIAVRGNHDEALFRQPSALVPASIQAAAVWTRAQLTAEQQRFLATLPLLHREAGVTYAHASADAPEQWPYLRTEEQVRACLAAAGTPLTFIGHVHVPKVYYETPQGAVRELDPVDGAPVPLSAGSRFVINVGSVGQPRDGNNAACYVLFDDAAASATFYRLPYDFHTAGEKIRGTALDPFFAERLAYGR